jgi:DNA-binding winged helix-turn-helix (wHTH) protein/predicted ATPase
LGAEVALEKQTFFDPFCLDQANECLWRGSQAIKLRPKAFAVLDYLAGRPGQLVTKDELLNAVWPETFVGEAVLKVAVRQIREALDDDSATPRFIETAHRRGYRFIGPISKSAQPALTPDAPESHPKVVGRDNALSRMHRWIARLTGGERQVIFVTGEAGIGKTALVDAFVQSIASDRSIRIVRGQCLEQYGTSEAYLPVLEAIGRLCREHPQVVDVLRAHAPMWLLQLPSLVSASDRELLNRQVVGATRERMLREMGDALEVLTADLPLVIVLEDLHWSDYSTLDLISYLARRRHPAKLMLIGTYRPVDVIVSGHPLKAVKRELLVRQQCEELPLEYLNEEAVGQFLSVRFPANRFPAKLAALIHERTEGNPLFMTNAVDYLLADGSIVDDKGLWQLIAGIDKVDVGVPDSIRQMIGKQIDHLDASGQRTLEVASVVGAEFSTLALVAGLEGDRAEVEARCHELARQRQFIQESSIQVLPDGETVIRYGFIHALYQSVLYERISSSRRVHLHRRIGEQAAALYGERARELAAELAMHFERGANYMQAAKYLRHAAENEIRRFAYQGAVGLARRGLALLEKSPDTRERTELELGLQLTLGMPLIATEGYAAPAVGDVYSKARELCRRLGETSEIPQVLWGLWTFHILRAELGTALQIAEDFLRMAERLQYAGLAMRGQMALEISYTHLGEYGRAVEHFEKASLLYDPELHRDDAFLYALNPGIAMRCFASWSLWFLGRPDQALQRIQQALALARELSEPHGMAHALFFAAILHQLRREARTAQEYADATIAVASEHGLVMYQALGTMTRGWALIEQGGEDGAIELIREGLAAVLATGASLMRPHFLALFAESLIRARKNDDALRTLEEALEAANRTGEKSYMAELYRLKGELLLKQATRHGASRAATVGRVVVDSTASAKSQAEGCFNEAIQIARRQQAKSLELRAVASLARHYQEQGNAKKALGLLAPAYSSFTEGFDTIDLREAKSLLEELQ